MSPHIEMPQGRNIVEMSVWRRSNGEYHEIIFLENVEKYHTTTVPPTGHVFCQMTKSKNMSISKLIYARKQRDPYRSPIWRPSLTLLVSETGIKWVGSPFVFPVAPPIKIEKLVKLLNFSWFKGAISQCILYF